MTISCPKMAGESELTSRLKRRGSPATLRMPRSSVLVKARAESCRGSAIVSIAIVSVAIVSRARGGHLPRVGRARLGIAHTQSLDIQQIHALVLVASAASAAAAAALCRHLEALDQARHHEKIAWVRGV